ncbi:MAG: RES family NAD+ phosphorylase [Deltaproteobacteria bacterium]|nr:RES family NAD+ phosphorylase [Deltaproteobacteria bacterium]
MRVYRIVPASRAAEAFLGLGGLSAEGRWHTRGRLVVYTSFTEAAARLEVLAHCASPHLLPPHVRIAADIPDRATIRRVDRAKLPSGWEAPPPYLPSVQALGDGWLATAASLGLRVPSALSATDDHLLLNPLHPEFTSAHVASPEPCVFDSRLTSLRR